VEPARDNQWARQSRSGTFPASNDIHATFAFSEQSFSFSSQSQSDSSSLTFDTLGRIKALAAGHMGISFHQDITHGCGVSLRGNGCGFIIESAEPATCEPSTNRLVTVCGPLTPPPPFLIHPIQYATVNIYVLKADGVEVLTKRELTVSKRGRQRGGYFGGRPQGGKCRCWPHGQQQAAGVN
jgi:hypothetical protein